ncbi:DUF885 family protein [Gemmatimonadota bacterium]
MRRTLPTVILTLSIGALFSIAPPSASFALSALQGRQGPVVDETSEMRGMLERYETDRAGVNRFYNLSNSDVRLERMQVFYRHWQHELEAVDFNEMGQTGRIDYILFKNHLALELSRIDHLRERIEGAVALLPFSATIIALEESRRRMEPLDPEKAAVLLEEMTDGIKELKKTLEDSLKAKRSDSEFYIRKSIVNRAAGMASDLQRTLQRWYEYYGGFVPLFDWWTNTPYAKCDEILKDYIKFLREKILGYKEGEPDPVIGDPIGRDALLDELAFEMIPYTPEELIALAEQEYAWCESEYKRAARELGYGDDWHAALEYVKTLHVAPGKQDSLIRELAVEAIAYLDEHDLVTIPDLARETWRIEMMSLRAQETTPFFTYGGQKINVSYPTDGMTNEQKIMSMRGNNIHFSRATVQHELIPGHHLQGFMGERYSTWRSPFRTAFLSEGWCLHWEMLLWDLGFPKTPENRMGMLFWRIHRCARIIVSLKFHLGEMTPEEMIDFLVEKVGHERDGATSEVRRYVGESYGPLYQCAYLVGGWQLRALHSEFVGSGQMTNREFHDTVLREGSIPIEMIRARLTSQRLTRDFSSEWRFRDR